MMDDYSFEFVRYSTHRNGLNSTKSTEMYILHRESYGLSVKKKTIMEFKDSSSLDNSSFEKFVEIIGGRPDQDILDAIKQSVEKGQDLWKPFYHFCFES